MSEQRRACVYTLEVMSWAGSVTHGATRHGTRHLEKVCTNPRSGSSSENMPVLPKTSQGVDLDMCKSPVYPFEDGEVAFNNGIAILPDMGVFSKPVTRPGNPLEHIWGLEQQSSSRGAGCPRIKAAPPRVGRSAHASHASCLASPPIVPSGRGGKKFNVARHICQCRAAACWLLLPLAGPRLSFCGLARHGPAWPACCRPDAEAGRDLFLAAET